MSSVLMKLPNNFLKLQVHFVNSFRAIQVVYLSCLTSGSAWVLVGCGLSGAGVRSMRQSCRQRSRYLRDGYTEFRDSSSFIPGGVFLGVCQFH